MKVKIKWGSIKLLGGNFLKSIYLSDDALGFSVFVVCVLLLVKYITYIVTSYMSYINYSIKWFQVAEIASLCILLINGFFLSIKIKNKIFFSVAVIVYATVKLYDTYIIYVIQETLSHTKEKYVFPWKPVLDSLVPAMSIILFFLWVGMRITKGSNQSMGSPISPSLSTSRAKIDRPDNQK